MFSYLSLIVSISNYIIDKNNEKTKKYSLTVFIVLVFILSLLPKNISQLNFIASTVLQYYLIGIGFSINFLILLLANLKLKLRGK